MKSKFAEKYMKNEFPHLYRELSKMPSGAKVFLDCMEQYIKYRFEKATAKK